MANATAAVSTVGMTKDQILAGLSAGTITIDAASKALDGLKNSGKLSIKVSEKGAISVYGLQRMPVTLYVGQWERLLGAADDLKSFITANDKSLSRK